MTRQEQEPTETRGGSHGVQLEHPAFGQIAVSRVQGDTTLFGSDFVHRNFITISIHRSQLNRDLNRDWEFPREELIEVWLSEAQWAHFVSSPNQGTGTACTLYHVAGRMMPKIPLRKQTDVFSEEVLERCRMLAKLVRDTIAGIEADLEGVSGKKRGLVLSRLQRLHMELNSNMPFVAATFGKYMETTVEKAKTEVLAYMQGAIARAGLAALKGEKGPLMLDSGEDKP